MINPDDFDASFDRLIKKEYGTAEKFGFGVTRQGRAISGKYYPQLVKIIEEQRAQGRPKPVWRLLKRTPVETLARRLISAGITLCWDDKLGVDADGNKTGLHAALWIGKLLGAGQREPALVVGYWGAQVLAELECFELLPDGTLIFPLCSDLDAELSDVLWRGVKSSPFLSPLAEPPEPWTRLRRGGLPPGHWASVSLVNDHHPMVLNAVAHAIGTGAMKPVLDAVNSLQATPYMINEPVLKFALKSRPDFGGDVLKGGRWDVAMATAEWRVENGRFWIPLIIDFRGRVYPLCYFSFVREDAVRGLFLFAEGKPISEEGLMWLKSHVAARADGNSFSHVKKPSTLNFLQRIKWVDDNLGTLRAIGEAVLRGDDPATLDWALKSDAEATAVVDKRSGDVLSVEQNKPRKPLKDLVQFLAACVELVRAIDVGPQFITRLPLTFAADQSKLTAGTTIEDDG